MSDEPNSKRAKMSNRNFFNKNNQKKQNPKNYLEPGVRGFLATCNYAEKDCVRECYNLLNEYADQEQRENEAAIASEKEQLNDDKNDSGTVVKNDAADDDEEEEDISSLLEKEIKTINTAKRQNSNRFQQIDTGVNNCVFIKTTTVDHNELGVRMIRDIAEKKVRKTRALQRIWPVDVVCKANITDIKNAAGKLFDKVFLQAEPLTFSITVNKRLNSSKDMDRNIIIHEIADLISFKNNAHKVDLKNPQITVNFEIIKGHCCISILKDYFKLKKYNVDELTKPEEKKPIADEKPSEATEAEVKDEKPSEDVTVAPTETSAESVTATENK